MSSYAFTSVSDILTEAPSKGLSATASGVHETPKQEASGQAASRVGVSQTPNAETSEAKPTDGVITSADYEPQFYGKPWTAPVYAKFNTKQNIQTMPFPVACVADSDKCTCYTDQATAIRQMDDGLCRDFVENGIYNEFRQTQQQDSQKPAA